MTAGWHVSGPKSRAVSALFVGLMFISTLAACSTAPATPAQAQNQNPAQGEKPVRGGSYTEGNFVDAVSLQPLLTSDTASGGLEALQYNAPLLRLDPETLDYSTKYGTADSYEVSPDGLKVTYKLKTGIKWSDGQPITSADYKFTFDKMMDPKVDYPYRSLYQQIDSVDAPDPQTLVFHLRDLFCPAVAYTIINPIPMHVFKDLDINDNPYNLKPTVGSGPWLLKEWVKDSYATFTANENFYLGRPNIDTYTVRVVKDQNVALSMFKSGEVDAINLRSQDWDEVKQFPNTRMFNYFSASGSWLYVAMNMQNDILKDLKVRQALQEAVDRKSMIERIKFNLARPTDTIYTPSSWAYNDNVYKATYDLNKARQLLDEAGWKAPAGNSNGTRVKDGKPLKMRIIYNAGNNERETIATVMQQSFKQIGVEVEVISEETAAYLNRFQKTHDFELMIGGWSSALEPHGSSNLWMTGKPQNAVGFSDPKVDELFPKAAAVPGCKQSDRAKVYGQISEIVSSQSPYIFLWESQLLSAVNDRFVTNPLTKLGYDYRMWEWYSKTGK